MEAGFYADFCRRARCGVAEKTGTPIVSTKISQRDARATEFLRTTGKLALAEHCYYQTGPGVAEGGCEMPVEEVEPQPGEQELTFVRMFTEPDEQVGTAGHVVIKSDSKIEILAGKVMVTWEEG